jgi:DNA-directed RNA polymerase subunit RPC12/RpoP
MASTRELRCPNGCPEGRFEALNAVLIVDPRGRYLSHDARQATYVCATCQSVAVDIAAAAREMRRDRTAVPSTLTCPVCGVEMLPPEDDPLAALVECPACGARFTIEEGLPHLHGRSEPPTDGD